MNAGDRYRHRASGRVVELVAPVSHTSGVILRPQDRAWSCRIVAGNGCATRIQERTLRRAWDLVPAVPPTAPEPPRLFRPQTTRAEVLDYIVTCEATGDTGIGYRIACDLLGSMQALTSTLTTPQDTP